MWGKQGHQPPPRILAQLRPVPLYLCYIRGTLWSASVLLLISLLPKSIRSKVLMFLIQFTCFESALLHPRLDRKAHTPLCRLTFSSRRTVLLQCRVVGIVPGGIRAWGPRPLAPPRPYCPYLWGSRAHLSLVHEQASGSSWSSRLCGSCHCGPGSWANWILKRLRDLSSSPKLRSAEIVSVFWKFGAFVFKVCPLFVLPSHWHFLKLRNEKLSSFLLRYLYIISSYHYYYCFFF